ncbi:MAG: hypothetical protein JSU01_23970 [Bacteroidetes bacterium]|nr:hypothetical protein [Bacteroidota bacterium]
MPYKKFLPFGVALFFAINCFAQETVNKKNRIFDGLIERYTVLKDSQEVKQGLYQVFTRQDKLVVRGGYAMNKKTGIWHFYNKSAKLLQIYDYDKKQLMFEAKQYVGSNIGYMIDRKITDKDTVTKPVKIGGRYWGYLPYLSLYRTPFSPYQYNIYGAEADIELLISPLGRLADYKVIATFPYMDYTQTLRMDVNLFKEEDREFIPATFNHEPILSRIIIKCRVDEDGQLQLRYYDEN